MPGPQLVFFAGWLAAAFLGGALLVYGWQRWLEKRGPR